MVDQNKLDRSIVPIPLCTAEELRLISYILSLNATKIRLSSWQEQHLPQEEPSPCLATFICPLYREDQLNGRDVTASTSCVKTADNLKRCASCKAVSYFSAECQRASRLAGTQTVLCGFDQEVKVRRCIFTFFNSEIFCSIF